MNANIKRLPGRIPQWTFAERVRKVRRDMGLTQEAMALELGIGDKRYSAWETGRNNPDNLLDVAVRLEEISGVPRLWFIGWVDDSKGPTSSGGGRGKPRQQGDEPLLHYAPRPRLELGTCRLTASPEIPGQPRPIVRLAERRIKAGRTPLVGGAIVSAFPVRADA